MRMAEALRLGSRGKEEEDVRFSGAFWNLLYSRSSYWFFRNPGCCVVSPWYPRDPNEAQKVDGGLMRGEWWEKSKRKGYTCRWRGV